MADINILYDVRSNPYIRISLFWSLFAPHKEVLEFEYDGKKNGIGIGALNFDAKKTKVLLEKIKTEYNMVTHEKY